MVWDRSGPVALLLACGIAAGLIGGPAALLFAIAAVLGFGMLHGISDLALVARDRRVTFAIAYLTVGGIVLAIWLALPALGLALFLVASAIHFAVDDVPASRPLRRLSHGLLMVAGPAVFHRSTLAHLFELMGVG